MKKKITIVSISILLVLGIILSINSTPKDKIYMNKNKIDNNKSLAIYLENETGNYSKINSFPLQDSGYTLNTSKSVCNGSTSLSWNNEEWGLELDNIDREETKCYLYFDLKKVTIPDIIAANNPKTEQPDFSQTAETDEGVYAVSDGMYGGTSYYWRGAATTNYVKFAGFCWRIVRINGDKTMRLIYDGTTCHSNGQSTTENLAIQNQAYNASNDRSEYVGWTYSTGSQRTTSGTASNAKSQTDNWFNTNITGTNLSKVADGKFCNDRNTALGYSWSSQPSSVFYYAARERLQTNKTPTLACPTGDVYTLKAGLITADEVAYAGEVYGSVNISYYLYNGKYYWTMSPFGWNSPYAVVFYVDAIGDLSWNSVDDANLGLRPVINLKADTTFTGNGTIDNPYEVL